MGIGSSREPPTRIDCNGQPESVLPCVVFLGASGAGKSTLIKQLRLYYGDTFTMEERLATKKLSVYKTIRTIQRILKNTPVHGCSLEEDAAALMSPAVDANPVQGGGSRLHRSDHADRDRSTCSIIRTHTSVDPFSRMAFSSRRTEPHRRLALRTRPNRSLQVWCTVLPSALRVALLACANSTYNPLTRLTHSSSVHGYALFLASLLLQHHSLALLHALKHMLVHAAVTPKPVRGPRLPVVYCAQHRLAAQQAALVRILATEALSPEALRQLLSCLSLENVGALLLHTRLRERISATLGFTVPVPFHPRMFAALASLVLGFTYTATRAGHHGGHYAAARVPGAMHSLTHPLARVSGRPHATMPHYLLSMYGVPEPRVPHPYLPAEHPLARAFAHVVEEDGDVLSTHPPMCVPSRLQPLTLYEVQAEAEEDVMSEKESEKERKKQRAREKEREKKMEKERIREKEREKAREKERERERKRAQQLEQAREKERAKAEAKERQRQKKEEAERMKANKKAQAKADKDANAGKEACKAGAGVAAPAAQSPASARSPLVCAHAAGDSSTAHVHAATDTANLTSTALVTAPHTAPMTRDAPHADVHVPDSLMVGRARGRTLALTLTSTATYSLRTHAPIAGGHPLGSYPSDASSSSSSFFSPLSPAAPHAATHAAVGAEDATVTATSATSAPVTTVAPTATTAAGADCTATSPPPPPATPATVTAAPAVVVDAETVVEEAEVDANKALTTAATTPALPASTPTPTSSSTPGLPAAPAVKPASAPVRVRVRVATPHPLLERGPPPPPQPHIPKGTIVRVADVAPFTLPHGLAAMTIGGGKGATVDGGVGMGVGGGVGGTAGACVHAWSPTQHSRPLQTRATSQSLVRTLNTAHRPHLASTHPLGTRPRPRPRARVRVLGDLVVPRMLNGAAVRHAVGDVGHGGKLQLLAKPIRRAAGGGSKVSGGNSNSTGKASGGGGSGGRRAAVPRPHATSATNATTKTTRKKTNIAAVPASGNSGDNSSSPHNRTRSTEDTAAPPLSHTQTQARANAHVRARSPKARKGRKTGSRAPAAPGITPLTNVGAFARSWGMGKIRPVEESAVLEGDAVAHRAVFRHRDYAARHADGRSVLGMVRTRQRGRALLLGAVGHPRQDALVHALVRDPDVAAAERAAREGRLPTGATLAYVPALARLAAEARALRDAAADTVADASATDPYRPRVAVYTDPRTFASLTPVAHTAAPVGTAAEAGVGVAVGVVGVADDVAKDMSDGATAPHSRPVGVTAYPSHHSLHGLHSYHSMPSQHNHTPPAPRPQSSLPASRASRAASRLPPAADSTGYSLTLPTLFPFLRPPLLPAPSPVEYTHPQYASRFLQSLGVVVGADAPPPRKTQTQAHVDGRGRLHTHASAPAPMPSALLPARTPTHTHALSTAPMAAAPLSSAPTPPAPPSPSPSHSSSLAAALTLPPTQSHADALTDAQSRSPATLPLTPPSPRQPLLSPPQHLHQPATPRLLPHWSSPSSAHLHAGLQAQIHAHAQHAPTSAHAYARSLTPPHPSPHTPPHALTSPSWPRPPPHPALTHRSLPSHHSLPHPSEALTRSPLPSHPSRTLSLLSHTHSPPKPPPTPPPPPTLPASFLAPLGRPSPYAPALQASFSLAALHADAQHLAPHTLLPDPQAQAAYQSTPAATLPLHLLPALSAALAYFGDDSSSTALLRHARAPAAKAAAAAKAANTATAITLFPNNNATATSSAPDLSRAHLSSPADTLSHMHRTHAARVTASLLPHPDHVTALLHAMRAHALPAALTHNVLLSPAYVPALPPPAHVHARTQASAPAALSPAACASASGFVSASASPLCAGRTATVAGVSESCATMQQQHQLQTRQRQVPTHTHHQSPAPAHASTGLPLLPLPPPPQHLPTAPINLQHFPAGYYVLGADDGFFGLSRAETLHYHAVVHARLHRATAIAHAQTQAGGKCGRIEGESEGEADGDGKVEPWCYQHSHGSLVPRVAHPHVPALRPLPPTHPSRHFPVYQPRSLADHYGDRHLQALYQRTQHRLQRAILATAATLDIAAKTRPAALAFARAGGNPRPHELFPCVPGPGYAQGCGFGYGSLQLYLRLMHAGAFASAGGVVKRRRDPTAKKLVAINAKSATVSAAVADNTAATTTMSADTSTNTGNNAPATSTITTEVAPIVSAAPSPAAARHSVPSTATGANASPRPPSPAAGAPDEHHEAAMCVQVSAMGTAATRVASDAGEVPTVPAPAPATSTRAGGHSTTYAPTPTPTPTSTHTHTRAHGVSRRRKSASARAPVTSPYPAYVDPLIYTSPFLSPAVYASFQHVLELTGHEPLTYDLANHLLKLWHDRCVAQMFLHFSALALEPSICYFLNRLAAFVLPDYVPSDKDVVVCSARTLGTAPTVLTVFPRDHVVPMNTTRPRRRSRSVGRVTPAHPVVMVGTHDSSTHAPQGTAYHWRRQSPFDLRTDMSRVPAPTGRVRRVQVVECGGQLSERGKWLAATQSACAVVYMIGIAGFDSTMSESPCNNRAADELRLWRQWCRVMPAGVDVVLLLNMADIFEFKIDQGQVQFSAYFPEYHGPNKAAAVLQWLTDTCLSAVPQRSRKLVRVITVNAAEEETLQPALAVLHSVFVKHAK